MKKNIFLFLLCLILLHADLSSNNKTRFADFNYEVVFYSDEGRVFYNMNGNSGKSENITGRIGFLKMDSEAIYFSDEKNDAYKYDFKENAVLPVQVFSEKPADSGMSSKRLLVDMDSRNSTALYNYEIKDMNSLQKIQTNLHSFEKLTSIASDEKNVFIGTAVNGLQWSPKNNHQQANGATYWLFRKLNAGLPFIPFGKGLDFYEEIRSLHMAGNGDLYAGTGVSGGVYLKKKNSDQFESLPWPEIWKISDVNLISTGKNGEIWVSCTQGFVTYKKVADKLEYQIFPWTDFPVKYDAFIIQNTSDRNLIAQRKMLDEQPDSGKKHRMQTASDKRLFYSSPYNLKTKYNAVIHLLDSKNFDGMVMDVKDDRGFILYNSRLKLAHEIGAVRPVFDLPKIIQLVHEKNKYLAVRIVVFKDPVLFENHPYAIWDKTGDFPWTGNPKERWLDPYNPALADKYYVPLIEELTALGVDEIQLDYIRFPSDGLIGNCLFRYKKGDKSFSEAIEDFLVKIRQATPLPLSLDIYGYQGLYRTGGAIGQDMEVLGKYADVISPMLYSSHFGDLYLTDIEKDKRVYRLIRHSISRAEFISRNRFLIRPYLQAFPMKSAIWGYGEKYFTDQIRANVDERGSGYSFWGSIENMQALDNSLNHRQ